MKYVLTLALLLLVSCGDKKKSDLNDSNTNKIENSDSIQSKSGEKDKKKGSKKAQPSILIGPSGPQSYTENGVTVDYEIHEMELAENTEVVGWGDMDMMTSSEENTFTFSKKANQVKSLEAGQIVVLAGKHVGRVESVNQTGNKLVLTTSPANLTEAFETLVVDYDADVNWKELQKSAGLRMPTSANHASMFQIAWPSKDKFAFKINGYDLEGSFNSKPGNVLEFDIKAKRTGKIDQGLKKGPGAVATLNVGVSAKGYVAEMGNKGTINIDGHKLKSYTIQNKYQGETTLRFLGTGDGANVAELKPELPLFIIPFRVGLIPINLEISCFMSLRPILVAGGSSKGAYKFTYDTDTGFAYENGGVLSTNEKEEFTMEPADEVQSAGVKTIGFGYGFGFPVIKAKIFGNTIVPTTFHQFDCQSLWEPGIMSGLTPCQHALASSQVNASVNLEFFGQKYSKSFNIYKEEIDFNPCDE